MSGPYSQVDDEAGFTLVEVLAALSVFAIAGLGVMKASTESTRAANFIEQRALASIVAENQLAETLVEQRRLILGETSGEVAMADRTWLWTQSIRETDDAQILEIEVSAQLLQDGQASSGGAVIRSAYRRRNP